MTTNARPRDGLARLEMRGITKAFPGVIANSDVHLSVQPGEIHALLGENGAGKSTLVKMIYGIMAPDSGTMLWEGQEYRAPNPRAARKQGIGMVFQHFSLFEAMDVVGMMRLVGHTLLFCRVLHALTDQGFSLRLQHKVNP